MLGYILSNELHPQPCVVRVCGVFFHYRSMSWVTAPLSSPQVFSLLAGWNHHDKSHHERVFGCVFGEHMHSFLLNVYLSVTARSQGWHMLRCSKYCQTVSQIGCNNWLSSSRRWGFQLFPSSYHLVLFKKKKPLWWWTVGSFLVSLFVCCWPSEWTPTYSCHHRFW